MHDELITLGLFGALLFCCCVRLAAGRDLTSLAVSMQHHSALHLSPLFLQDCECYNHSNRCSYIDVINAVICVRCKHNTRGQHCHLCKPGYYRNATAKPDDENICIDHRPPFSTVCVCVLFLQTVIVILLALSLIAVMAQDIVNVRKERQGLSAMNVCQDICGTMAANMKYEHTLCKAHSCREARVCDSELLRCQNGGTCVNNVRCQCPPEYTGLLCEKARCENEPGRCGGSESGQAPLRSPAPLLLLLLSILGPVSLMEICWSTIF
ncbi:hypothetical protein DNTS_028290 [Danionella cerebrum]|uniref:EGF-like domain-containing protein n=1 Tax=Danionella cerebrum TaxID=2873325 RepID=A0A553NL57_9TELE|nr:hypothetical protein DNTS_028290 [Danionella translucida]